MWDQDTTSQLCQLYFTRHTDKSHKMCKDTTLSYAYQEDVGHWVPFCGLASTVLDTWVVLIPKE